ncbi:MAG: MerR family transcriptional regulator [Stellaceae bacterium]
MAVRDDTVRDDRARADVAPALGRAGKSAAAFRTTGEVALELDLPTHVLRFWEAKFPQLKPLRRGGGRRYYRPEDVDLLRRIRRCLHQHGYTIRGVQKLLRDGALRGGQPPPADAQMPPVTEDAPPASLAPKPVAAPPEPASGAPSSRQALRDALEEVRRQLLEIRAVLATLVPP